MEDKINQALVQLGNELQGIVSARKQVEETVNASNELLDVVSKYVSSVKELCERLKVWEDDLRTRGTELGSEVEQAISHINSSCAEIITSYSTKIDGATSAFISGTKGTLDKFIEQNNKLSKKIEELNTFKSVIENATRQIDAVKDSIEQISKDLKQSQDRQDEMLEDIKQIVSSLPESIQNGFNSISQAVSSLRETLAEILGQINGKADTIDGKINTLNNKADTLAANLANLTTLCQNISGAITTNTINLTTVINKANDDINKSKDEIKKSANTNRWLIIGGFTIIVILQILQFVLK